MKWTSRMFVVTALIAVGAAPVAAADRKPFVFDAAHSQINFVAEALLISAHGSFDKFEGDVQLDSEKLENSTLSLSIDAASINTRIERRDNHLRSADFFDAANHTKITFVSTQITRVDDKNLAVTGDLTIRGVTKQARVPLRVVFLRDGSGRFKGEFQINRKDFNINYNSAMNPIEDMVTVQFDFHMRDRQMMEERQRQRQQQQPAKQPPQ